MLDARRIRAETRVIGEFRTSDAGHALPELAIVANGEHEMSVAGLERLVRHEIGVRGTHAPRGDATEEVIQVLVGQPCHLAVVQGHIDSLAFTRALPGMQRREDRVCRVHARHDVGDRDADLLRPAFPGPGYAHETRRGLDHSVVTRFLRATPCLSER